MKKRDILKLIEANRKIKEKQKLAWLGISLKENEYPNIEELKEEIEILRSEIENAIKVTEENQKIIKDHNCTHEVRLKQLNTFTNANYCIFCGKRIDDDNDISFKKSINRNRHTVNFTAKYQEREEGKYIIENGYTEEDIYQIIIELLKNKDDEEEIDFVEEFKKLNLNNCEINEKKKVNENFILIISGTNTEDIEADVNITTNLIQASNQIIKELLEILYTKIKVFENHSYLESAEFARTFPEKNINLNFTEYSKLEELKQLLNYEKETPFKIIIDMSNLYTYQLRENEIHKEKYNLELSELFPEAHIIRICDLSQSELEKLKKTLQSLKEYNDYYAHNSGEYYHLEDDDLKQEDLNNITGRIKSLLR